jgi:hypothetical protein
MIYIALFVVGLIIAIALLCLLAASIRYAFDRSIATGHISHGLRRATRPKFERCWLSAGAVAFSAGGDGGRRSPEAD